MSVLVTLALIGLAFVTLGGVAGAGDDGLGDNQSKAVTCRPLMSSMV